MISKPIVRWGFGGNEADRFPIKRLFDYGDVGTRSSSVDPGQGRQGDQHDVDGETVKSY